MVVFRALGWLLLAMAVAAIVHDGLAWWTEGSFHLLGLGDLWSHLDTRSLADAQTAVQRRVSSGLWFWLVRPVLMVPVLPAFLVLGLFFLWIGNRGGGRPEAGFVLGPRRPGVGAIAACLSQSVVTLRPALQALLALGASDTRNGVVVGRPARWSPLRSPKVLLTS